MSHAETSIKRRRPRRVLVLGAGMSGLACARELEQRNYQVLLVEARDRVGGRLKGEQLQVKHSATVEHKNGNSSSKAGKKSQQQQQPTVDLGGALIHGMDENPLAQLTKDLNVPVHSVSDCLLMNDSGWPVDPKEDDRVSAVFNECLEESFRRIPKQDDTQNGTLAKTTENRVTTRNQPPPSFGALFQQVCAEHKGAITKNSLSSALMSWHQANLEVSCGAGLDRMGLGWNEDEAYGFDGDHCALESSWKPVVEALAEPLDILFRAQVQKIHILPQRPALNRPAKRIKTASAAAAAAPTGAPIASPVKSPASSPDPTRLSRRLQGKDPSSLRRSNRTIKKPVERFTVDHSLPQRATSNKAPTPNTAAVHVTVQRLDTEETVTLQADAVVCTLPLGILQEGSIEFDPPLSTEKQNAIASLGTGLLNKCTLSFPHIFWQDSDFLGLAENAESSYLVLNLSKATNHPVLVFMYGGDFAESIQEWTDHEIVQDCLAVLRKICGKRDLPPVLDYCCTRWGKEEYSKMAFTFIPPGVDGPRAFAATREPVVDDQGIPTLMFAGEHTTPFHPSTIHGAFLSGIREAYRLDCAVDPEALGNFQFSEEELYQRTFAVGLNPTKETNEGVTGVASRDAADSDSSGRVVATTDTETLNETSTTGTIPSESGGVRHRRRGASEVMRMRRTEEESNVPNDTTTERSPATTPTRRSHRGSQQGNHVTAGNVAAEASDDEREGGNAIDQEQILALENRVLKRSVESYGPNYDYIQQYVTPVHTGLSTRLGPERTVNWVQSKCQRLSRKRGKPRNIPRAWIAPNESHRKASKAPKTRWRINT